MNVNNVVRTITIRGEAQGIDELTGKVNKLADAQKNVAVVSEQSSKRVLSLEDAWKKQTMKLDEAARSQVNIARETRIADGALREGLITQTQHAERLNLIGQRYAVATVQAGKFANQTGLNRYELLNLSRQMQDVGVSLASGQSPFVVLTQQGSQILDVFQATTGTVRGFFSQAIGWAGRFVTSATGVATGVAAIGAGALYIASSWRESQREIEKSLLGIGRQSGVTVKDINEIARTSATATGLSVDQARGAALEFVKTGAIYKDNIKSAVDATHNFAIVTGQDATEAAKSLAAAFVNPVAGADALNAKLGNLDGRTREYIATLVSQNRNQEAQAVLLRSVEAAVQGATSTLGPFEKAWDAVANAAIRFKNAVGAALTPDTPEQRRDALVSFINRSEAPRLEGTPVDNRSLDKSKVAAAKIEVEALNESLRETARATALAFPRDAKISLDADNAVRELLPYIDQLKKVEELINKIKAAQASPGAQDRQGLAGSNAEAARAAEVLAMNIKNTREETDRANAIALQLAKTYNTGSIEVAKMRAGLADQLVVASAVGGQARLAAQEQATYNDLIRQGKTEQDAAGVAADQRAVAQAQINTQAKEQLVSLQNQFAVVSAVTGVERMRAQAQATYNQLVHDGVDAGIAAGVAAQQHANAQAQVNAQAQATLLTMQDQRAVASAITGDEQISAQAQATYNGLRRQGVDASKASAIASEQERQARERISAQITAQAFSLDQQTDLIYARLNGTEATVKAEQAYTNAIRAGADAYAARAAEEAVLNNERAKAYAKAADRERAANDAIENQIYNQQKQIELLAVEGGWLEKSVREAHAYNDALRAGASAGWARAAAAQAVALYEAQIAKQRRDEQNAYSQQHPLTQNLGTKTDGGFGAVGNVLGKSTGKYMAVLNEKMGFNPTPGFYEDYINRFILDNRGGGMGGGTMDAINKLFEGPVFGGLKYGNEQLDTGKLATIDRLTELLPDAEKIGVIERELRELSQVPRTIARDELVKQLTDKLTQLKEATEANTEALQLQLDPIYSQGHDYINALKIGYYKAASGFDGIVRGGTPGMDSVPINIMAQQGERVMVIPPGNWSRPMSASNVSNDNKRVINNNITQNIYEGGSRSADRFTTRQKLQGYAESFIRAAG